MSIFRSLPGVAKITDDRLCRHMDNKKKPCFSFGVPHKKFYALYVLEMAARASQS